MKTFIIPFFCVFFQIQSELTTKNIFNVAMTYEICRSKNTNDRNKSDHDHRNNLDIVHLCIYAHIFSGEIQENHHDEENGAKSVEIVDSFYYNAF